ncbi:DUF7696 family protein [Ralstonia thomasii]
MRTDAAYRHECEVRTLARWTGQQIAAYLREVEKQRGRPAAERLLADVKALRRQNGRNTATSG